jgi:4-hydroxy-tetrahydrodipicolinate reductase
MSIIVILGDGPLGRAVADAATGAGHEPRVVGRPASGGHAPSTFHGADAVVDASRPDAVAGNLDAALAAGVGRFVVATTAWDADRPTVQAHLVERGAAAVASANFSLGVALFGRLVDTAVALFGQVDAFDPYLVEWHRAAKRDRPSGTARDLARRITAAHPRLTGPDDLEVVAIRAGASPGMHLVGFDASGETLEIRLTARDRSAYAAGILASLDWLARASRPAGLHTFEPIVDELIARQPVAVSSIAVSSAA